MLAMAPHAIIRKMNAPQVLDKILSSFKKVGLTSARPVRGLFRYANLMFDPSQPVPDAEPVVSVALLSK